MAKNTSQLIWTKVDEAPQLASYSLLPIIRGFLKDSDINVENWDISLAGRIIANFPENLTEEQRIPDYLAMLGELTQDPNAFIIKLPNISASVPQLIAAIKELQEKGYDIPDYPEDPKTDEEKKLQERFAKILGSAVNPVLRQGNSDRRSPKVVKEYSQKNPHKLRSWEGSRACIAHMDHGDFYDSENSTTIKNPTEVRYEFVSENGDVTVLKEKLPLLEGEVLDSSAMNVKALREYYETEMQKAKANDLLLGLELKATMMKVSDPVLFGHAVSVYFKDVFEKHGETFKEIGVNPNMGLGDLYQKIQKLPDAKREAIENDIKETYNNRPALNMVNSDKGITNLHAPNDIIIDANMPVVIREGGKMWGPDGELADAHVLIPDRCYATSYKAMMEDCQKHGAYDPATMGSVPNVGLMAQKAEEYGSHDKTFIAPDNGTIRIVDNKSGDTVLEQKVEKGDVYRSCQTKDIAIKDWVKLAVTRARYSETPVVFWLDKNRAHDAQLIAKVETYLKDHDTKGLEIHIMAPQDAMTFSVERIRKGLDTISATGNVLRDYLTDLFPILEIGTSAKMLSIVPLLAGGGLFETGAGGSAPKHVQQFQEVDYLRWDSLGEFSALWACLDQIGEKTGNERASLLGETLNQAIAKFLDNKKSPARKVGYIDNRGSHFYLAMYWAEALAAQSKDKELKERFTPIAKQLVENEDKINKDLIGAQRQPVDMGGYYLPDFEKTSTAMRPSQALNKIIDSLQ